MIFLIFWIIGIIITIITTCFLTKIKNTTRFLSDLEQKTLIQLHLLVLVCIILVIGIPVAKFVSMFCGEPLWVQILVGILPAGIAYEFLSIILELDEFEDKRSHFCFVLVSIISILGWTILINNYNRNIEEETKVIVKQTQERELLYFCNVPVQEITGEIHGSSSFSGGNISGSIDTTHELTYWYVNESGKGLFDTAPANYSEIEFFEEGTPYVKILSYYKYTKIIDHNIESERKYEEKMWKHYVFHIPKTIMQYTTN